MAEGSGVDYVRQNVVASFCSEHVRVETVFEDTHQIVVGDTLKGKGCHVGERTEKMQDAKIRQRKAKRQGEGRSDERRQAADNLIIIILY